MDNKRLEQCIYDFREGGEHNGQLLFQARLYERGRPVAEYNFWLSPLTRILTAKIDSFDRGKGFASETIRRTIPEQLEQIAEQHGSFTHQVEFTPQGEVFTQLMTSLGYNQEGKYLVKNY